MNLPVFYDSQIVGLITTTETGPSFTYDASWAEIPNAFPVSLSMPIRSTTYDAGVLVPWLSNLLPEGDALHSMGLNIGASIGDVLSFIEKVGRDTAGALSFGQPSEVYRPSYRPIPDADTLEQIINELPARPFLVGDEGVAMSLAGAQQKLPVLYEAGRFSIPLNGAPSTHILKPDNSKLFGSVQNEALCMILARRLGFAVAEATTGVAGQRSYLLVTRYDRVQHQGRWYRLHQEDFCQALGRPPGAKYERNGSGVKGIALQDLFGIAARYCGASDNLRLLRAVILNVLLTNVDSHAKNYSLLFAGQQVSLAPLYDLMCGSAWGGITQNMAQSIGGQLRGSHVAGKNWSRMARTCGLSEAGVRKAVKSLARGVSAEIGKAVTEVQAMPAGGHPMLSLFAEEIMRRCRTVLVNMEIEDNPKDELCLSG